MLWRLLPLVIVLLFVLVTAVGGVIFLSARVLLSPPRMTDGKALWLLKRLTPADLGLRYQDLDFFIHDEAAEAGAPPGDASRIKIAGWWMPSEAAQGRCVILLHGYGDAKVGAIAWAPTFHALGLNVLAIDLRAHGASGGRHTTGGFFERHDVSRVIDQLKADHPERARQLVLAGVSLGAAVACATAAMRDDIDAVILECPFSDYRGAIAAHARMLDMPGPFFVRGAAALAQRQAGADFDAVRPVDLISRLPCPLMMIRAGADLFVTPSSAAALDAACAARPANRRTTVWVVANAHHVAALHADAAEYRRRIEAFLQPIWSSSSAMATVPIGPAGNGDLPRDRPH